MSELRFDSDDARDQLEGLDPAGLDRLPFGVVRLSARGEVVSFNAREAAESGVRARPVAGVDFFLQVAPCMNTPSFRGRIEAAAAAGDLDLELGHTGDLRDPHRFIRVRVLSARDGGYWLLMDRG